MRLQDGRGRRARRQQDTLLVTGSLHQSRDLPATAVAADANAGLCAVADGVAASPCPQRASHALLDSLRQAAREGTDCLQDAWG